jgi:hypothetical protein
MATEQEIEATRKLSAELEAKAEALMREALDSSKSLAPLFDAADREHRRLQDVLGAKTLPEGTDVALFAATCELVGDFADLEVQSVEGIHEAGGGGKKTSNTGPARAAPRRGMRI